MPKAAKPKLRASDLEDEFVRPKRHRVPERNPASERRTTLTGVPVFDATDIRVLARPSRRCSCYAARSPVAAAPSFAGRARLERRGVDRRDRCARPRATAPRSPSPAAVCGPISAALAPAASVDWKPARWLIWPAHTGTPRLVEIGARLRDQRGVLVVAPHRRGVDDDRIGLVALARGLHRLAHRIEIEEAGPRRDQHQGRGADRLLHHHPHGRRGVDEHRVEALDHRKRDRAFEAALGRDELQPLARAPRMPELERALRVGVDDEHALARDLRLGGKLRGQRALARAALAGRQRDDIHRPLPALWLRPNVAPYG